MTHTQYKKLRDLADEVSNGNNLGIVFKFDDIKQFWDTAVHHNKNQNLLIRDGLKNENVTTYEMFSDSKNKLVSYDVKAHKQLSRIQYYILEVCSSAYLSYEATANHINKHQ